MIFCAKKQGTGRLLALSLSVLFSCIFLGCPQVESPETSYVVTFMANGGVPVPKKQRIAKGRAAVPPGDMSKTGYAFAYWYAEGSESAWDFDTGIITGDTALYAHWEPIAYTVTFNLNGGEGAVTIGYAVDTPTITLPAPVRNGYAFEGWYTDSDLTGEDTREIAQGSAGNREFWAKWTAVSYAITFDLNGGDPLANPPASYTVESPAVTLPTPARTDYLFDGWYAAGQLVTEIPQGSTGSRDYWAKWTAKALERLEIASLPAKTAYLLGEPLYLSGLTVKKVYNDGSHTITGGGYEVRGDTFTAGAVSLTLAAAEDAAKTVSLPIQVSPELMDTGLPVVYIETQNGQPIVSKEDYVNGTMRIKQNGAVIHTNGMRIKGRGNATWSYPKKPYKIKLDQRADFFGMGNDKDWVLLANYCDKTLLRTGIAFHLSRVMNFPWTPDAQFVELVFNGQYLGSYQLAEGVKRDSARVDIPSAGYLIERDGYYMYEPKHFVTGAGYGYSFKNPDPEDDLTDAQRTYIMTYLNDLETVLAGEDFNDPETGYQQLIDVESFARWFLFQNVLANIDPNPFLTKNDQTAGSKLFMGPVWDFEWSMGIGWYEGPRPRPADYWVWNHWYYARLLEDSAFVSTVKNLWNTSKAEIRTEVLSYMSGTKQTIYASQALNFRRWNLLNTRVSVGGIPLGSFEAEVECDRQFFINRLNWLDEAINGL